MKFEFQNWKDSENLPFLKTVSYMRKCHIFFRKYNLENKLKPYLKMNKITFFARNASRERFSNICNALIILLSIDFGRSMRFE